MSYVLQRYRRPRPRKAAGLSGLWDDFVGFVTGNPAPAAMDVAAATSTPTPTQVDTSTLFPSADVTPAPSSGGSVAPDVSQVPASVRDMQHAINRYFGQLIGSPIAEDNGWGAETSGALGTIGSGMPGIGYTDQARMLVALVNAKDVSGIAGLLNKVADQQNWLYDSSAVAKTPAASGSGPRAISPTKVTSPDGFEASLNSLASKFGLPTWALFVGAAAGAGYVFVASKKARSRSKSRTRRYR